MGVKEILCGPVRIHAGEHYETVIVRCLGQFAIQIAAVQELRPMVQGKLARIIRDDSPGVNDHSLDSGKLPEFTPPGNVVTHRIALGDVCLSPACCAAIPCSTRGIVRRVVLSCGVGCRKSNCSCGRELEHISSCCHAMCRSSFFNCKDTPRSPDCLDMTSSGPGAAARN